MKRPDGTLLRVGISCGDINGIGLEVIMKTFMDPRVVQDCIPVLYCSPRTATLYRKLLNISDFSFHLIKEPSEGGNKYLNLINCLDEEIRIEFGKESESSGKLAFASLEAAVRDLQQGKTDVLVTAPIHKKVIQQEQFAFPGHTEYLTQKSGAAKSLMVLVSEGLRVATLTGHMPLQEVSKAITKNTFLEKTRLFATTLLQDFRIRKPRIAVLGLNPHAGDGGLLGKEEQEILLPCIQQLREEGHLVMGPYPADGFFASNEFKSFDGILAMYHDQGLVPFKSMAFDTGVNFTAGLPFVRTSPDHGTAFDIAGKMKASESSFRSALYAALDIWASRNHHEEITSNPLKITPLKRERF